jgi:LEA14-like dessication related protein
MLPRLTLRWLQACSLLVLGACSLVRPHYERPDISVVSVELRGGNLTRQNFAVKLHVQNPNDRDLPVHSVHADLSVEGDPVASGTNDREFVVPAKGGIDFDVTVTANLLLAAAKIANRMSTDSQALIAYNVTGAAEVDLPFVHTLPFHQGGSFALNQR